MSIQYDKYYGVDFAIEQYLQLIKFWKTKKPGITDNSPLLIIWNPIIMSRLLVSAWSSQIARTNELALDIAETEEGKQIQKEIEESLDESELLQRIIPKVPLTSKETKQQLKNALAHAEYTIATNEEGETIIEIDSPKIKGIYTVPEVEELASIYSGDYTLLDRKDKTYDPSELLMLRTNNKRFLKESISNIRYGNNLLEVKPLSCITILGKVYEGSGTPLSAEEQKLIEDYILYGGLQNWIKLTYSERGKIFSDRILRIIEQRPNYRSSADMISYTLDFLINKRKAQVSPEQIEKFAVESPSIYADLLIDLGFLCLNHIKEAQAKQALPGFNYHDINLKGVKCWPEDTTRIVSVEEQQRKLTNQISALLPAKTKAKDQVTKAKEQLDKLDLNTKIPPEIKKQQYARKKAELEAASSRYQTYKTSIATLQTKYDNATEYLETNDFFKHLRNSISHGFYSIDFSTGLSKKDLGKIVFHFEDWEIDKNDRSNRKKVFSADITADKLTEIFKELQSRIEMHADSLKQQDDKRCVVIDRRASDDRDENYQKRLEKALEKRGGIIVRG